MAAPEIIVGADFEVDIAEFNQVFADLNDFETVSDLKLDAADYTARTAGDILRVRDGGFVYEVAASGADDQHLTTAGGVKLYVLPNGNVWPVGAFGLTMGEGQSPATWSANRTLLRGVMDTIRAAGGGVLRIPEILEVDGYVPLWPKVSLDMEGGGISNPVTTDPANYGFGQILLPGNFHPDFTEDFTFYAAGTPTQPTATLTVTGQGSQFAVGDQVLIETLTKATVGDGVNNFDIGAHSWLNVVTAVNGDDVTFRHDVDIPNLALEVAVLKNETCRGGEEAFFWQDAFIKGGALKCQNWHWCSDSAALDCVIEGVNTVGSEGPYGNSWQRCVWRNCRFDFFSQATELSGGSRDTLIHDCQFNWFKSSVVTTVIAGQGPAFQEVAYRCVMRDCKIDFGDGRISGHMLLTLDAAECGFENIEIIGGGGGGSSAIQMGDGFNHGAAFPKTGNYARNIKLNVGDAARVARIVTGVNTYENTIEGVTSTATLATGDAVLINAKADTSASNTAARILGCTFPSGGITLDQFAAGNDGSANVRLDLTGSHIPAGMNGGIATDTFYRRGNWFAATTDASRARLGFRRSLYNLAWTNGETPLGSFPMGQLGRTAEYKVKGLFSKTGTAKDVTLTFELISPDGLTVHASASFTLSAAATGAFDVDLRVVPAVSGGYILFGQTLDGAGNLVRYAGFDGTLSDTTDVEMRIKYQTGTGPGDEGDSGVSVHLLRTSVVSIPDVFG